MLLSRGWSPIRELFNHNIQNITESTSTLWITALQTFILHNCFVNIPSSKDREGRNLEVGDSVWCNTLPFSLLHRRLKRDCFFTSERHVYIIQWLPISPSQCQRLRYIYFLFLGCCAFNCQASTPGVVFIRRESAIKAKPGTKTWQGYYKACVLWFKIKMNHSAFPLWTYGVDNAVSESKRILRANTIPERFDMQLSIRIKSYIVIIVFSIRLKNRKREPVSWKEDE